MRNLKILGLALVATFATSAVGVSVASADELTSESNPAILSGGTDEGIKDSFLITSGNTSCKEVFYDIGTITTPTTTVTAAPTYPEKAKDGTSNCTSIGFPATIHTNGCKYLFHVTGGTSTVGDITIQCDLGKSITVTAIGAGTTKCTIHVGPQTLTGDPATYFNIGGPTTTREITVSVNAHGLTYTHTAGSGVGACTGGSASDGTFVGKGVVKALNDAGTAQVGLFLSNA